MYGEMLEICKHEVKWLWPSWKLATFPPHFVNGRQASPASTGSRGTTTHCTWILAMPKVLATSIPLCTANVSCQLHLRDHGWSWMIMDEECEWTQVSRDKQYQAVLEFQICRMLAEYWWILQISLMIGDDIDAYDLWLMTLNRECVWNPLKPLISFYDVFVMFDAWDPFCPESRYLGSCCKDAAEYPCRP